MDTKRALPKKPVSAPTQKPIENQVASSDKKPCPDDEIVIIWEGNVNVESSHQEVDDQEEVDDQIAFNSPEAVQKRLNKVGPDNLDILLDMHSSELFSCCTMATHRRVNDAKTLGDHDYERIAVNRCFEDFMGFVKMNHDGVSQEVTGDMQGIINYMYNLRNPMDMLQIVIDINYMHMTDDTYSADTRKDYKIYYGKLMWLVSTCKGRSYVRKIRKLKQQNAESKYPAKYSQDRQNRHERQSPLDRPVRYNKPMQPPHKRQDPQDRFAANGKKPQVPSSSRVNGARPTYKK